MTDPEQVVANQQAMADILRRAQGPWGHGWGLLSPALREMAIKAAAFDYMEEMEGIALAADDAVRAGALPGSIPVLRVQARHSAKLRRTISNVLAHIFVDQRK